MNSAANKAIAEAWLKAFNTRDLEYLLSLYDENAQHYSPKLKARQPDTNGLIRGKKSLRDWWQDAFDRLPTLHYKATNIIADNSFVFIEYTRQVKGEEDLAVGEVLEIRDGLIVFSRVYHG
jgi:hypothetical protein